MAKPSKRLKVNKPDEDSNPSELEKQTTETSHQAAEAAVDEPPPEEHHVLMDSMDVDPENAKPPSPTQLVQESEDVTITRTAYTAPGNPTALAKHNAKEEFSAADKGKWKLDLESYA